MRWPWTISKPSGVIAMHERLVDVFTSNGLITAFAAVGLLMLVCNLVSKHLTGGRIHGSAIAIAAGLVLSYIGGVGQYRDKCDEVARNGYSGFVLQ